LQVGPVYKRVRVLVLQIVTVFIILPLVLYGCETCYLTLREGHRVRRRMLFSGIFRRATLVTADVSEERVASIIRVTGIGKLGTTNSN
jgi:hypothetical protein